MGKRKRKVYIYVILSGTTRYRQQTKDNKSQK